jgi:diguanylate cyclase (GGDEF)-like protein
VFAAILIFNSPVAQSTSHKPTVRYFSAFFVLSAIGYIFLLIRPIYDNLVMYGIANALFLLNFYCLRFGFKRRLGRPISSKKIVMVSIHILIFVSAQIAFLHYLPDDRWFRIANTSVNILVILVGCLNLLHRDKSQSTYGENIAQFSLTTILIIFTILPALVLLIKDPELYILSQAILFALGIFILVNALQALLMSDVIEEHYQTSIKDPLTGIYNRRYFFQEIRALFNGKSENLYNSVILCDVDKFKSVNDNHGHDVGDEVLTKFAKLLESLVGDAGIVARYGGEEFTILLRNQSLPFAIEFAERLRMRTEQLQFSKLPEGSKITASFGVSEIWSLEDIDLALKLADDALLKAKAAGRNKVCST